MSADMDITGLDRTVHLTNIWLNEIDEELGYHDKQRAYHALRAVLHNLRDRLTVDEAADFAAQLPTLVRGIFYEGWRPSATPVKVRDREEFLERIRGAAVYEGMDPVHMARVVFHVLENHVDPNELNHVREMLPKDIQSIFS